MESIPGFSFWSYSAHCGLIMTEAYMEICVNLALGYGLLADDTKLSPEPMLTSD